ncbi:MAG: hypothetical protein KJ922_03250, partial [Nanoarchaeota archaeon]|nr:hypothetical protein [Nanoarchaeota archaeon]
YFDCYITKTGLIDFWIEGHGGDTKFLKLSDNFDCTFESAVPVELSSEDEAEVLEDIGEEFTPMDTCEVTREFSVTLSGTEVKLTNCDQANLYYEVIDKCALSSLDNVADIGLIPADVPILEHDPIVMWNFAANAEEKYTLPGQIDELCKRKFKGVSEDEELLDTADIMLVIMGGIFNPINYGNLVGNLDALGYSGQFTQVKKKMDDIVTNANSRTQAVNRLDLIIVELEKDLKGETDVAKIAQINNAISQVETLKSDIQSI